MFTMVKKITGESKKDYLYRVMKEGILSLKLLPGQVLKEGALADAFQVSRTPIREVMSQLTEEHLVKVVPQVGTYVSKIKPTFIEEAAFMHYTLAKEILISSCKSFPQECLLELKKNLAYQEEWLGQKGTALEFHKLDENFHYKIFQGNRREHVWKAISRLDIDYNRMKILSNMDYHFKHEINQHQNIISIIEKKEVDLVEEVLSEHILKPISFWRNLYNEESPFLSYFDYTSESSYA